MNHALTKDTRHFVREFTSLNCIPQVYKILAKVTRRFFSRPHTNEKTAARETSSCSCNDFHMDEADGFDTSGDFHYLSYNLYDNRYGVKCA